MTESADRAEVLVGLVVEALGLEATVEVEEAEEEILVTVEGDDLGLLIGRHGQTIDAVQHLARCVGFRDGARQRRLVVDAAGYRERRRVVLEAQATEAAEEATRNARAVPMEPMSAAERRIVHEHLRDRGDVETYSEGEEPNRRLVIVPRDS